MHFVEAVLVVSLGAYLLKFVWKHIWCHQCMNIFIHMGWWGFLSLWENPSLHNLRKREAIVRISVIGFLPWAAWLQDFYSLSHELDGLSLWSPPSFSSQNQQSPQQVPEVSCIIGFDNSVFLFLAFAPDTWSDINGLSWIRFHSQLNQNPPLSRPW